MDKKNESPIDNIKQVEQKKPEQIEDSEVVKKFTPEILINALAQKGIKVQSQMHFSGPLPLLVLEKLTQETANKMAENLMLHIVNQDELQNKFLDKQANDKKDERKDSRIKLITTFVFVIIIIALCIFTNNIGFIKDMIPLLGSAFGGIGIGVYVIYKKSPPDSKPIIKIEENE